MSMKVDRLSIETQLRVTMVHQPFANCYIWQLVLSVLIAKTLDNISCARKPKASLENSCSTTFRTNCSKSLAPSYGRKNPISQPMSLSIHSLLKMLDKVIVFAMTYLVGSGLAQLRDFLYPCFRSIR